MLKHSPEPWHIEDDDEPECREIVDSTMAFIATVYGPPEAAHDGDEKNQLDANARIIAAAPRMYALLVAAQKSCGGLETSWHRQHDELMNELEKP